VFSSLVVGVKFYPTKPNLWREPEPEKTKEELESEAKRKLKEDFPDYT
jgi:hypothetical protein